MSAPSSDPLNPYAPPAAFSRDDPVAPESRLEPLTTTIAVWLCLGGLNAVLGALLCYVIVRLVPLNVVWAVAGFGALVTTVIFVDRSLREQGQLAWSRALRSAALIKAAIQVVVLPDLILGALATGVVHEVLGRDHPLAALPISLLYGGLVTGLIVVIAALIHRGPPQRMSSECHRSHTAHQ